MIRFGTGGWRAEIGVDFICENVRLVAAGIARLLQEQGKSGKPVIIGYDRRFLSEDAAKWVAEVLTHHGIRVWFLRRSAPTPLIMHTVKDEKLYCGIEITASHNPAAYNGIKLIVDEGRDAPQETTQLLEQYIDAAKPDFLPFEKAVSSGMVEYLDNPFNKFLDDIMELLDMKALRNRGLRVLFDPMHGSGAYPLQVILFSARCTVDMMNANKDAYFGGMMPAPSEAGLRTLRDGVLQGKYDLGIAMDGDGDRLGIIDGNGRYINANEILCMLYWYLVRYKNWRGPVVRNIATTHMLDAIAESFGEKCYEVPVGFKHISAKIEEVDAVLGGESSGGLTVRGHIHGKDSVYAASLFAEMVSVTGMTPSQILDKLEKQFGIFVMEEANLRFAPERKKEIENRILKKKELPKFSREVARVSYADGCKVYFADGGFVVCRFSGTEPLLRIFAESGCSESAKESIQVFREFLNI